MPTYKVPVEFKRTFKVKAESGGEAKKIVLGRLIKEGFSHPNNQDLLTAQAFLKLPKGSKEQRFANRMAQIEAYGSFKIDKKLLQV